MGNEIYKNRVKTGILQQFPSLSILEDNSTTFNYVKSIHMDIKLYRVIRSIHK